MSQEASSRSDSPDKCDLSSAQTKEESDNSVFDGGGGGSVRSEASSQPSHRSSPSSQFNPSQNVSPGGGSAHGSQTPQTPSTPPRPRAPSVPPHLLAHHQFWSQNTGVQGFATQRLLNGVISSAVGYGQNTTAVSTSGTSSISGSTAASCVTTGATTTATSCKYCCRFFTK